MTRVALPALLTAAQRHGYAVGAFNAIGLESAEAIVGGAEDAGRPVILAISENAGRYASLPALVALAVAVADRARVPVAVHFDHGTSAESCMAAIDLGCDSAMLDGSALPLGENISLTRRAVDGAHARGAACEGELGIVSGKPGQAPTTLLTAPEEAAEFVAATAVDALACALGTRHGMVTKCGVLDLDRAAAIAASTGGVPLVLHGSSGVPDEMLTRLASAGIVKVNLATDLNVAFTAELRTQLASDGSAVDPRAYLAPARARMRDRVTELCTLLAGSSRTIVTG